LNGLTSEKLLSEIEITANLQDVAPIKLMGFDVDVLISFDFEKGEKGCQTKLNGDPGWPEIPPTVYISRIRLSKESTFSSGDENESDFLSVTHPARFDITRFLDNKTIRNFEDELLEECEETY